MAEEIEPGTEFAGYRIERLLGRGGMALVFLAQHVRLQRKVALKVLAPDISEDERFRERFIRESRSAAALDHPHIVPVYDAAEADGRLFIAMRYVQGTDLRSLVHADTPLELERVVTVLGQVASALDVAHANGLVHRDVKPANVLVDPRGGAGGRDHAYLADFGLAKHSLSNSGLTQTGQFLGTIDYVAPEQIEGGAVDGRADIYALGCMLFESLTGRQPFVRESAVSVMYAHLLEPPPSAAALRPGLPAAVDEAIARAMAKRKEDRFPTATELVTAARDALAGAEGAGSTTAVLTRPAAVPDRGFGASAPSPYRWTPGSGSPIPPPPPAATATAASWPPAAVAGSTAPAAAGGRAGGRLRAPLAIGAGVAVLALGGAGAAVALSHGSGSSASASSAQAALASSTPAASATSSKGSDTSNPLDALGLGGLGSILGDSSSSSSAGGASTRDWNGPLSSGSGDALILGVVSGQQQIAYADVTITLHCPEQSGTTVDLPYQHRFIQTFPIQGGAFSGSSQTALTSTATATLTISGTVTDTAANGALQVIAQGNDGSQCHSDNLTWTVKAPG